MAIPAGFGAPYVPPRARLTVQCVACRSRFESDGVTTGDRVRCPMCREVVEVAQLIAEKRRYRSRVPLTFSANRASRRRGKRIVVPVALIALALLAFFAFCLAYPELSLGGLLRQVWPR